MLNIPLKLDLQFFSGEKTEKATPKKRQDERKKGKVAKSQDVNTAILLLFSFTILALTGSLMKENMLNLYEHTFTEYIFWDLNISNVMQLTKEILVQFLKIVAPIMGIALVASIAANLLQIGFLFTTEPLKFDFKKIDPIKGAKRIFSIRAIVELLKSVFKISAITVITFAVIWIYKDDMFMLSLKTPENALTFFGQVTIVMVISAILALLILSALDYLYQRYDFEKNIRMSKHDIKDEHKNIEGDPLIKSKIKERQRQMAMSRMMAEVPDADVVITNPTHYAIAIKYDESKASAPYIIAKGTDRIALKIKEIAKEHGVIKIENKPLAQALYNEVEINEVIPEAFYQAVAEVLAYVYQMDKNVNELGELLK